MADIELIQPILGMRPYTLIEADTDPADGELVLRILAGGGPTTKDVGLLPFLMVAQLPADQNPITEAIRDCLAKRPDDRGALSRFAEYIDVPMPEAADGGA